MSNFEIVFTPSALLDLLSNIDEFSEFDLSLSESLDGNLQLQVGESYYDLALDQTNEIEVEDDIVEEIAEINEQAYRDLLDDETTFEEPIETGIITETLKTLLIGGVVRLAKNYLQN